MSTEVARIAKIERAKATVRVVSDDGTGKWRVEVASTGSAAWEKRSEHGSWKEAVEAMFKLVDERSA